MGKTVRPNVKGTIVEWLEHVRHIAEPRQFERVLVMRNHRSCERLFDVDEETDLEDLAARIQACCQRSGLDKYEVRALDEQHREIETYAVGSNKRRQRGRAVHHREPGAGWRTEARRLMSVVITELQAENASLRQENGESASARPSLAAPRRPSGARTQAPVS